MKQGTKVKLTKLKSIGAIDHETLGEDYWLIGTIIKDIVAEEPIHIWRTENSIAGKKDGLFTSSPVKYYSLDEDDNCYRIMTQNSQWLLKILSE